MKELLERKAKFLDRNNAIKKAYFYILEDARAFLSTLEYSSLRETLVRQDKTTDERGTKVHQLISPVLFLCLDCDLMGDYTIHFDYEKGYEESEYDIVTSAFIRSVYRWTMTTATAVNVEDCVQMNYVFHNCSELFEYIMGQEHQHKLIQLPYKPMSSLTKETVTVV